MDNTLTHLNEQTENEKSVYFMVFHLGNLFWMDYAALFSPAYTVLNAESRKQIQGDLVMHREASLHYRG